ncbi:MAG: hypothetical protein EBS05_05455 [Proteobacteria bacterium]|nr:hypothetical protein [Pseudomonadota bacterium]
MDPNAQKDLLGGMQKVSFVSAAFAVTAYNLRTRVIDLVLKIEGKPARVEEFCRIARNCGGRLTNLVILFTITSIWLGGLSIFREGTTAAKIAAAGSLVLFSASTVSFFYILFAFERLERFVLDEAEQNARVKEASRLFKPESVPESPDKPKTDGK